jgi:hypothetical protein
MRLIGRWSYPWYLWHWPILVLAEVKFGDLDWTIKVALMIGALGLAGLTHHFVEVPLMTSPDLRSRIPSAAAVGIIATVLATTIVLTVGTRAAQELGTGTATPTAVTFDDVFGRSTGANSGTVIPAPIDARVNDFPPGGFRCIVDRTSEQPLCEFGVKGGTPVVLFGDSKAHQWLSAFDEVALERGWELTVITQSGCPVPAIAPRRGDTSRMSQGFCSTWREEQIDHIIGMRPAIIFMSTFNGYGPSTGQLLEDWGTSLTRLTASGAKLVYVRDTPRPGKDIPNCISSALSDWSKCAFPVTDRIDPVILGELQGVLPPVTIVDLNGYLCDGQICPAVRNGILLYRDDQHLSNTAAKALAPALSAALDQKGIA